MYKVLNLSLLIVLLFSSCRTWKIPKKCKQDFKRVAKMRKNGLKM